MKKTLGQLFAGVRESNGLTMIDAALKCDLSESVVWKVEHDRPVRWETVHLLLTIALKIRKSDPTYQTAHFLWLEQRNKRADLQSPEANSKTLTKHAVEATRKFRNLVRDLDPLQTKTVLAAAQRSAAKFS
jgi:hypothetical protein